MVAVAPELDEEDELLDELELLLEELDDDELEEELEELLLLLDELDELLEEDEELELEDDEDELLLEDAVVRIAAREGRYELSGLGAMKTSPLSQPTDWPTPQQSLRSKSL